MILWQILLKFLYFLLGYFLTNAVSWPCGKRDVRIWMSPFAVLWQESFRSEFLRFWKVTWVPVKSIWYYNSIHSFWDFEPICNESSINITVCHVSHDITFRMLQGIAPEALLFCNVRQTSKSRIKPSGCLCLKIEDGNRRLDIGCFSGTQIMRVTSNSV